MFSLLLALVSASAYIQPETTPISEHLRPIQLTESCSGMDGIDCIYVINLETRTDRWERTLGCFREQGCFPNRVRAINGWELSKESKDQIRGPYKPKVRDGAIGCLLSHVSIYRDAFERGFGTIWICEDDIEFSQGVDELVRVIDEVSQIDPDWDLIYTDFEYGGAGEDWTRPGQPHYRAFVNRVMGSKNIFRIHGRCGTHSMVFSRKGIEKALHYFTHVYLWSPIDMDLHYVPGIREYSVKRNIVTNIKNQPYSDTVSF